MIAGLTLLAAPSSAQDEGDVVLRARVAATITPVISEHLRDGVAQAERDGNAAFVVELDTPGGLDTSMREIVQAFLGARVPVIVYVAPAGARAASAGAIIAMSAHVAAMAPGTAIGAATPVDLQGGDISDKIINDFAAYAESIARARGRNVEFARDAVRKGTSIPADEAVRIDVVDLTARDFATLMQRIDGREVRLETGDTVALRTAGAAVEDYDLRGFRRVLQWLADPNIAFLFLSLGTLGILYELASPGMGGAGIAGLIFIVLALFSLSVLPVNAVGAILVLASAALFVAEVFTPGVGVFAAGGTAALLLGGIFLFRGSVGVDAVVLVPIVVVAGGAAVVLGRFAWRTRSMAARSFSGSLVGTTAVVRKARGTTGQALIEGAWWTLRSDVPLKAGAKVRVVGMEDLQLIVEPETHAKEEAI